MSFYYGGIGHYMANTMVMFTLVVVVYTMLALAVYDEEGGLITCDASWKLLVWYPFLL